MSKLKVIDKKSINSIKYERELLCHLNHSLIVNLHYAFQDYDNLYLVLDLLTGGDLRYQISRHRKRYFSEEQTRFFIACIVHSLQYIHEQKIIHRDIKPENLVFDDKGYLHITDFGIAKLTTNKNSHETSGTPGYMAPEVMRGLNHTGSCDFFAVGVIAYELMNGRRPYNGKCRKEIKEQMMSMQIIIREEDIPEGWSEDSADFINRLLVRKDTLRMGYKNDVEIKLHPWLCDIDWNALEKKKLYAPFLPIKEHDNYDKKYCEGIEKISIETEKRYEEYLENKRFKDIFDGFTFYGQGIIEMEKKLERKKSNNFKNINNECDTNNNNNNNDNDINSDNCLSYSSNLSKKSEEAENNDNLDEFKDNTIVSYKSNNSLFKENNKKEINRKNVLIIKQVPINMTPCDQNIKNEINKNQYKTIKNEHIYVKLPESISFNHPKSNSNSGQKELSNTLKNNENPLKLKNFGLDKEAATLEIENTNHCLRKVNSGSNLQSYIGSFVPSSCNSTNRIPIHKRKLSTNLIRSKKEQIDNNEQLELKSDKKSILNNNEESANNQRKFLNYTNYSYNTKNTNNNNTININTHDSNNENNTNNIHQRIQSFNYNNSYINLINLLKKDEEKYDIENVFKNNDILEEKHIRKKIPLPMNYPHSKLLYKIQEDNSKSNVKHSFSHNKNKSLGHIKSVRLENKTHLVFENPSIIIDDTDKIKENCVDNFQIIHRNSSSQNFYGQKLNDFFIKGETKLNNESYINHRENINVNNNMHNLKYSNIKVENIKKVRNNSFSIPVNYNINHENNNYNDNNNYYNNNINPYNNIKINSSSKKDKKNIEIPKTSTRFKNENNKENLKKLLIPRRHPSCTSYRYENGSGYYRSKNNINSYSSNNKLYNTIGNIKNNNLVVNSSDQNKAGEFHCKKTGPINTIKSHNSNTNTQQYKGIPVKSSRISYKKIPLPLPMTGNKNTNVKKLNNNGLSLNKMGNLSNLNQNKNQYQNSSYNSKFCLGNSSTANRTNSLKYMSNKIPVKTMPKRNSNITNSNNAINNRNNNYMNNSANSRKYETYIILKPRKNINIINDYLININNSNFSNNSNTNNNNNNSKENNLSINLNNNSSFMDSIKQSSNASQSINTNSQVNENSLLRERLVITRKKNSNDFKERILKLENENQIYNKPLLSIERNTNTSRGITSSNKNYKNIIVSYSNNQTNHSTVSSGKKLN